MAMNLAELKEKMSTLPEVKENPHVLETSKFFDMVSELNMDLEAKDRFSVSEFLTSDDASVLMPKVIQGTLREAAEPLLVFKQFFQMVRMTSGQTMEWPAVSAMTAGDISEGQEYPKAMVDFSLYKTMQIRVGKYGLMFGATDEAISDSLWDVIGILTRGAGRAMARWEEQKRANAFHTHAHVRFDGDALDTDPQHPTGYGFNNMVPPGSAPGGTTAAPLVLNNTLSTMDWIDMIATLMTYDFTPTNVMMHPMYWPGYAKTIFFGGNGNMSKRWDPANILMGEPAIGAALPFAIQPILSPRVHFNKMLKVGDVYVVDRNEIGVELVKEEMTTEEWRTPEQDIRNIKVRARKGWGIQNKGRAIICARNISAAESYDPTVQFVHNV